MTDSIEIPVPASRASASSTSALAPLREPLFRSLWIAAVISYTGTWMQNVGAGWLMTTLTMSPFMVGLVQAAATLPVFLVILPAGALADMVDRRRLLLLAQSWMVFASGTLGVLTLLHAVTPWILLLFTFLLGLGAVMNDPAWQAITPEIVSSEQHASAVALNSAGFNVARAVGPAVGGLIVAAAGCGTTFLLNALSFFGVILFLYHWKRRPNGGVRSQRVLYAIQTGFHYVRQSSLVQSVLIRTATFSLAASAIWALLPIIARPHGATGYGFLLACFGSGALSGAAILPRVKRRMSVDGVVGFAIVLFAAATFAAGVVHRFSPLCIVLFAGGIAWIAILACLNVAAQTMSPDWVRARCLSMYLLVLQGGMALGSTLWGALASKIGVPAALLCSALTLIAGLVSIRRHRLTARDLAMAPSVVRD
ncbi:MAG: MFS transporter [Acidobacteria bacterium]|nr:MFS transporter [Acidobacteriota bacterium]MBV9482985.1 MFS transporter [Acidobacteriota bacterium]